VFIVIIDQVTKALAVALLEPNQPVRVIGSLLQLRLVRNPGAAFSLGESTTYVFTALASIAVILIVRYTPRITHPAWSLTLALVLAGAAGNLVDRLTRAPGFPGGHVVDFVQIPMWPVFNVADSAITIAIVVALILTVRGIEPDR
jgi:signal peptidase II